MAFSVDTNVQDDYSLIPVGDYEVVIKNAEEKTASSGKKRLTFALVIRNDIEQGFHNRMLFLNIYKKAEPNKQDASVDGYIFNHLMSVVKNAGGIPDGTSFETVEDLCRVLVGKCLKVYVTHETWSDGSEHEKIDMFSRQSPLSPSEFPECRHVYQQKRGAPAGEVAPNGFAQRSQRSQFASENAAQPPAVDQALLGDIGDFEELPSGVEVPF